MSRQQVFDVLVETMIALDRVDIDALASDGFEGGAESEIVGDWVRYQYGAASNQLLAELFELVTQQPVVVEGIPETLLSCPCCGFRTLTETASYDICRWCNWEDNGTVDVSRPSSVNGGDTIRQYRERLQHQQRATPSGRWIVGQPVFGQSAVDTESDRPEISSTTRDG